MRIQKATIITTLFLLMTLHSIAISDTINREQDKKKCMENLSVIGDAIKAYKTDHNGDIPNWLSGLYPKYLHDPKILLCPADETDGKPAGFTAYKDPKMPCSYLYEFNPMQFPFQALTFDKNPQKNYTYKEAKIRELKYFGGLVPIVRCKHHSSQQTINLSYDGRAYFSPGGWESAPESINVLLSFFQNALANNQNGLEAEFSLREIFGFFMSRNRLPDLRKLLEQDSHLSMEGTKILGQIYESEGNIQKSIEIYQRVIKSFPDDFDTRMRLAKLYASQNNYGSARSEIDKVFKLDPRNPIIKGLQAEFDAIHDVERIKSKFVIEQKPKPPINGKAMRRNAPPPPPPGPNHELPSPQLNYLTKIEELLLVSNKDLLSTVQKSKRVIQGSSGDPESVTKLWYLYQTLEKSLSSHSGEWKTYTTSNGLINDYVYSIVQDNRGVLWIGTGKGVCQYDGESFVPFINDNELSNDSIQSILIDKQENIWFGTGSDGVFKYDGKNVIHYAIRDGLAGDNIAKIIQDRKGNIWFVCNLGGISKYDGKKFITFTTADGLVDNSVQTMMEDSKGNLWIGTAKGLSQYNGKTFTSFTDADGLIGNAVYSIIEDHNGNILFGTDRGINCMIGNKLLPFMTKDGPIRDGARYILEDHAGNLWFILWRGVSRYDGNNFTYFTEQDGLADNSINVIFEDREGNMWFGHPNANGLSQFNPEGLRNYGIQDGLPGITVTAIAEDKQGNLWIAADGIVSKYNGITFTQPIPKSRRILGNVSNIITDVKGNLWFGTEGHGLIRYDGMNYTRFTTQNGLIGNNVSPRSGLLIDKNDRLWIGASNAGVSSYNGVKFTNLTMADGLASDAISSLVEDKHGDIWIGTQGGGIDRYDGVKFTNFITDDGLIDNAVMAMYADKQGQIWIGTQSGLSKYDGKSFTTPLQFNGKLIMRIIEDREGYFWFGTANEGIIKTDGKTLMQITTADGLPNNRIFALHEDKNGNIWIGTEGGLAKYKPNHAPPLILIESTLADKVYTDSSETISIPTGRNLKINYRGISYRTRPEAMQYFYQLDGYDKDWQGPTHDRSIDYPDIKPGTYTFKVKAVDRDLNYSKPAQIKINVRPPFYMSTVFLVPTGSFGIILITAMIILTTGFVKHRKRIRAYERLAAQELKDAHRVQMSLMPESPPAIDGLEIAGKCVSANTVSGDFFNYLQSKHPNEIAIIIADVTGKAMIGAMNAVMTDGILHAKAEEMDQISPSRLMAKTNDVLITRTEPDMYVTMQIGLINTESKTLTLANAGHHALPILLRNGEIQFLEVRGFPLGLMEAGIEYDEERFQLQSRDVLIFMTDGIIETLDNNDQLYSDSGRLKKIISKFALDMSPEFMVNAIISDAIDFGNNRGIRDDDMTVVVAKVL